MGMVGDTMYYCVLGQGVYGKSPCLSPSFAVNLKLLSKIKPTEKYKELYILFVPFPAPQNFIKHKWELSMHLEKIKCDLGLGVSLVRKHL